VERLRRERSMTNVERVVWVLVGMLMVSLVWGYLTSL
jgi:hypothetical protein